MSVAANKITKQSIAALIVLFALIGLIWLAIIKPIINADERANQRIVQLTATRTALFQRLGETAAERDYYLQQSIFDGEWRGPRRGAIEARLQSTLAQFANSRGVSLRSVVFSEPDTEDKRSTIEMSVEAEATLDQISAMMRAIEDNSPLLAVRNLKLSRIQQRNTLDGQPNVAIRIELTAPFVLAESE